MLYVYIFAPAVVGLAIGAVLALLARRVAAPGSGRARVVAGVAAGVVLALHLFAARWFAWPWSIPEWILEDPLRLRLGMLVLPLALGTLFVAATAWAPRVHAGGVAPLTRRGITTLTRRWPLVTLGLLLVAAVGLAVAGGLASSPDDEGRHTMFYVELGRDTGAGATIYGWFFSLPALVVAAVLALVTAIALALLVARPLGADPERELARRRWSARAVLAAVGGALLLHLGAVLGMFAGTASLRASFSAGELGMVDLVGPFAALGPALGVAADVAGALGYALWWFVLLAAILPARRAAASS
jgi:hypothetical protein